MERTIYLLVAYDGTEYHGWQTQPGFPSVQGTIIDVLRDIFGEDARICAASRKNTTELCRPNREEYCARIQTCWVW